MPDTGSKTVQFIGREVPQLGVGLAALGRPGYINLGHDSDLPAKTVDEMRNQCWEVLDAAFACGVRYFDAARSYGRSEEFLASWLEARGIEAGAVCVGSKWGYRYTADWQVDTGGQPHEVKEHTLSHLLHQTEETSKLLGTHLNLYQIHSATLESGVLENEEALAQLETLKREKGWRIGLTLSGTAQSATLDKALHVKAGDGTLLFDCVQATWNLLEQSVSAKLCEAHAAGVSVLIKEAMANGRLTPRNTAPGFEDRLALLSRLAAENDTTVDALALACVMRQEFQPVVLSGASTVGMMQANAAAMELAGRIDAATVEQLCQALVQSPEEYWTERGSLAWN